MSYLTLAALYVPTSIVVAICLNLLVPPVNYFDDGTICAVTHSTRSGSQMNDPHSAKYVSGGRITTTATDNVRICSQ